MSDKKDLEIKIVNSIDELIDILGIKKGEPVQICTPQFEREYELEIKFIPKTKEELDIVINHTPEEDLIKMGVAAFDKCENDEHEFLKKGQTLFLFPGEWYEFLPNGYEVVNIFGNNEKFINGKSDDDIRYGCLPYGFVR